MNHPIRNIIVTGNWGAGKTTFCGQLQGLLSKEPGIQRVVYDSDRFWFEDAVRSDIKGKHSLLVADGPRGHMIFRALEGSIFNQAHRQMIIQLADTKPGIITVMEYATGLDGKFQEGDLLDQSANFLVKNLMESGAVDHTLLIQLYRPFSLRRQSNLVREDPTDIAAFDTYGQEGGLMMPEDAARLGKNFLSLNNINSLEALVANTYKDHIRPRLAITIFPEGNFFSMEGNPPRPEARF